MRSDQRFANAIIAESRKRGITDLGELLSVLAKEAREQGNGLLALAFENLRRFRESKPEEN